MTQDKKIKINEQVTFKNCATFTKCISHINDIQTNDVDNLDVVMPIDNLIECGNNYATISGSLW